MTRRRWIADKVHGNTAELTGEHASHLARVLRAQVGQEFDIATGDSVRRGKIIAISEDRVEFALGDPVPVRAAANLTLVLAIFKFDRMEWAIEKCTEIGVSRFVPLIARRTDTHLAIAASKRHERWQRLALQASEQSRRVSPPEIMPPIKFKELNQVVESTGTAVARFVLAESEEERQFRDAVEHSKGGAMLAIGPEGGWTEDELQYLRSSDWIAASLGDTILRAETAAIVAVALALDAMRAGHSD